MGANRQVLDILAEPSTMLRLGSKSAHGAILSGDTLRADCELIRPLVSRAPRRACLFTQSLRALSNRRKSPIRLW
jgi:hypothetical protein